MNLSQNEKCRVTY